jgi:hypothetical protein
LSKHIHPREFKSAERSAFDYYLRTGRRLRAASPPERKFNPWHDPRNGQFTFAPGGPRSLTNPVFSDKRGLWKPKPVAATGGRGVVDSGPARSSTAPALERTVLLDGQLPGVEPVNSGGGPRRGRDPKRRGGLDDPLLLEQAFPGLRNSPAGTIVRLADGVLELTDAARSLTREIQRAEVRKLVAQIRAVDPDYRFESLGEPQTLEGQANQLKTLRFERAVAFVKKRAEYRPLQIEVLRVMQDRADIAYDEGVAAYETGRLPVRLSREEAIGNFIDRAVKRELRRLFDRYRIDYSAGQPIRVVGREYDSSGTDRTYRIPDARVFRIAYDVTLTEKTLRTRQVQGYFASDFRPEVTIIIRPRQLGPGNTYAITSPRPAT